MFRELRGQIKLTLDEGSRQEEDKKAWLELDIKQRAINKEIMEARLTEKRNLKPHKLDINNGKKSG